MVMTSQELMLSTSEGFAQIYTTAMGEEFAINALPATPVVPMGFTSVTIR